MFAFCWHSLIRVLLIFSSCVALLPPVCRCFQRTLSTQWLFYQAQICPNKPREETEGCLSSTVVWDARCSNWALPDREKLWPSNFHRSEWPALKTTVDIGDRTDPKQPLNSTSLKMTKTRNYAIINLPVGPSKLDKNSQTLCSCYLEHWKRFHSNSSSGLAGAR